MSKDVKSLAKNFAQKAKDLGLSLSHSQSLELLAFTKGFADWNGYSASLKNSNSETEIKTKSSPQSINDASKIAQSIKSLETDIKDLQACLLLVDAINQCGGFKARQLDEIADYLGITREVVEDMLEQASEHRERQKKEGLLEFYKAFRSNKLDMYFFDINGDSFYIVAHNQIEAEDCVKQTLAKDGILIDSFNYSKTLSLDELTELEYYDDNALNISFLEQLSNTEGDAPYIFAQSLP